MTAPTNLTFTTIYKVRRIYHEKVCCCSVRRRHDDQPGRLWLHRRYRQYCRIFRREPAASAAAESTADTAAADSYKVAIVQQLDHASLDEIRVAIEKELDAKAAEKGITIEYKDFNGQNDATTLNQIGTQVVADGYDAIIPIATLAAQCMTTACRVHQDPGHLRGHLRPRRRRPDRH